MVKKLKVCIIGAESWGSAIATAVGSNVLKSAFDKRVHIYVYDELVRSNYLSEVINERHENIKYLPGIKLPENLIAINDLLEAAEFADILIFATPQSFVKSYCNILENKVKKTAFAVSLVKGLDRIKDGEIDLYSHAISKQLGIPCYSMMCANSAMEMAQGKLCEVTLGCDSVEHAELLTDVFETNNCKVVTIDDVDGVELCATLKDIIALGAGLIDGLRLGDNARVAALHLGLKEMMRFIKGFYPNTKLSTFFESCGVANSVASCYADKNVTFAKNFVTSGKTMQELEANLMSGRKLLGPMTAEEVNSFLEKEHKEDKFPLFTAIHKICQSEAPPDIIIDALRNHPDLSNYSISRMLNKEHMFIDRFKPPSSSSSDSSNSSDSNSSDGNADNDDNSGSSDNFGPAFDKVTAQALKAMQSGKNWAPVPHLKDYEQPLDLDDRSADEQPNSPKVDGVELGFQTAPIFNETQFSVTLRDGSSDDSAGDDPALSRPALWFKEPLPVGKIDLSEDKNMPQEQGFWYESLELDDTKPSAKMPEWLADNEWRADKSSDSVGKQILDSNNPTQPPPPPPQSLVHEALVANLDEGTKSIGAGLAKLIESHVRPYNNSHSFQSLKIKAKQHEEPKAKTPETAMDNQQQEKLETAEQEQPLNVVENTMEQQGAQVVQMSSSQEEQPPSQQPEELQSNKMEATNEPSAGENESEGKMQVLYEKDSLFGMRLKDYEPKLMRVSESTHLKETETMEQELEQLNSKRSVTQERADASRNSEEHEEQKWRDEHAKSSREEMDKEVGKHWDRLIVQNEGEIGEQAMNEHEAVEETISSYRRAQDDAHEEEREDLQINARDESLVRHEDEDVMQREWLNEARYQEYLTQHEDHDAIQKEWLPETSQLEEQQEENDKLNEVEEQRANTLVNAKQIDATEREAILKSGRKKRIEEPNMRHYSNKDSQDKNAPTTEHHEWDWLRFNEKTQDRNMEEMPKEELLPESVKVESEGEKQLIEEPQEQPQTTSKSDEPNEDFDMKKADFLAEPVYDKQKPITPPPQKVTPTTSPKMPSRPETPTPRPQLQPRSVPPPSPQTHPQVPQQPMRKDIPIQFDTKPSAPATPPATPAPDAPPAQVAPSNTPSNTPSAAPAPPSPPVTAPKTTESPLPYIHATPAPPPKTPTPAAAPPAPTTPTSSPAPPLPPARPAPASPSTVAAPAASPPSKKTHQINQVTKKLQQALQKVNPKKQSKESSAPVDYKGNNPYARDPTMPTGPQQTETMQPQSSGGPPKRKVIARPQFNPPLNPRMRRPRPPFDGRDKEYHTLTSFRPPPNLLQSQTLRSAATAVKVSAEPPVAAQSRLPTATTLPYSHATTLPGIMQHQSRSAYPPAILRGSSLVRVVCAMQLGILAAFFTRYSSGK